MKKTPDSTQFAWLERIAGENPLREDLEAAISKMKGRFKEEPQNSLDFEEFLENKIKAISHEHRLHEDGVKLYLSLDFKLYHELILYITKPGMLKSLMFAQQNRNPTTDFLNGGRLEDAYRNDEWDFQEFMEQNTEMFPNSSRERILELQREMKNRSEISKILNEFEYRVYLASLAESPDIEKISSHFNQYASLQNGYEKTKSVFYFYRAVRKKYEGYENKALTQVIQGARLEMAYETKNASFGPPFIGQRRAIMEIFKIDREFVVTTFKDLNEKGGQEDMERFVAEGAKTPT